MGLMSTLSVLFWKSCFESQTQTIRYALNLLDHKFNRWQNLHANSNGEGCFRVNVLVLANVGEYHSPQEHSVLRNLQFLNHSCVYYFCGKQTISLGFLQVLCIDEIIIEFELHNIFLFADHHRRGSEDGLWNGH